MATDIYLYDATGTPMLYQNVETIEVDTPTAGQHALFSLGSGGSSNILRAWSGGAVKSRDYTQSTYDSAVAAMTKTVSVTVPAGASVQTVYCKQVIDGVASTSSSDYTTKDYGTALSDASVTTVENQDGTVTVTGTTDISKPGWYPSIVAGCDYGGVASYIYLEVVYS